MTLAASIMIVICLKYRPQLTEAAFGLTSNVFCLFAQRIMSPSVEKMGAYLGGGMRVNGIRLNDSRPNDAVP
jgi:hypothetical protein